MSIVIVDDNPTNLIIVKEILRNAGYKNFETAESAMELFDILRIDDEFDIVPPVDLILLDLMMPEIDGIEACRRIQQSERLRDIPIIIVTALGDSGKLAEALDAGAIDYVMKPINRVELLARIRVALRLKYEKDWHKERDDKIRAELELAKQVQWSVLSQPIDDERVRIGAAYRPSFELAGDLYAWYPIDRDRYGIIILDMMGHGISSSLVCMFIASVLKDTITRLVDPEVVIRELNRYMHRLTIEDQLLHYYFTAIYMVVDTKRGTIEYVNAGHPAGILFHGDGESVLLDQGCCAVGFFQTIEICKQKIFYKERPRLLLFTDGLLDETDNMPGDPHLRLVSRMEAYRDAEIDELLDAMVPPDEAGSREDDQCLVVIDIKGEVREAASTVR